MMNQCFSRILRHIRGELFCSVRAAVQTAVCMVLLNWLEVRSFGKIRIRIYDPRAIE